MNVSGCIVIKFEDSITEQVAESFAKELASSTSSFELTLVDDDQIEMDFVCEQDVDVDLRNCYRNPATFDKSYGWLPGDYNWDPVIGPVDTDDIVSDIITVSKMLGLTFVFVTVTPQNVFGTVMPEDIYIDEKIA